MDLAELTASRRTIHNYKPEKVPDSVVERALELSLWAPNHRLTFPWVYFRVGEKTRTALADLAVESKGAKEPLSEAKRALLRESVMNPSHIILLGRKRSERPAVEHEDYATLAASVQIAALYLWEKGIGSKWTTSGWSMSARTYDLLETSADAVKLEGALLIGIPSVTPHPSKRPSLSSVLRQTK